MCIDTIKVRHFLPLIGTFWVEVESPSKEVEALHVSVGLSVVWVVTKDYKVNQNRSQMRNAQNRNGSFLH